MVVFPTVHGEGAVAQRRDAQAGHAQPDQHARTVPQQPEKGRRHDQSAHRRDDDGLPRLRGHPHWSGEWVGRHAVPPVDHLLQQVPVEGFAIHAESVARPVVRPRLVLQRVVGTHEAPEGRVAVAGAGAPALPVPRVERPINRAEKQVGPIGVLPDTAEPPLPIRQVLHDSQVRIRDAAHPQIHHDAHAKSEWEDPHPVGAPSPGRVGLGHAEPKVAVA
mmetsp:Transcript_80125/g.244967  ORF Transcript_80125/g.244967 Transcript_80125/m.244967 type:complete len:219 (-) Transcript_80125:164-820(-)